MDVCWTFAGSCKHPISLCRSGRVEPFAWITSQKAFKRQLKTFLFCDAFNIVNNDPRLFLSDITTVTVYFINFELCNALMVFRRVMRTLENV